MRYFCGVASKRWISKKRNHIVISFDSFECRSTSSARVPTAALPETTPGLEWASCPAVPHLVEIWAFPRIFPRGPRRSGKQRGSRRMLLRRRNGHGVSIVGGKGLTGSMAVPENRHIRCFSSDLRETRSTKVVHRENGKGGEVMVVAGNREGRGPRRYRR